MLLNCVTLDAFLNPLNLSVPIHKAEVVMLTLQDRSEVSSFPRHMLIFQAWQPWHARGPEA